MSRSGLEATSSQAEAVAQLREQKKRIRKGYVRRKADRSSPPRPPWDNANGFLKREVYRLVRHCHFYGYADIIEKDVRNIGRAPRRPSFDANMFYWGLLAVEGVVDLLDAPERRLFASQLLYAYRHDIPELHLIGFIYQLGNGGTTIFHRVRERKDAPMVRAIGLENRPALPLPIIQKRKVSD